MGLNLGDWFDYPWLVPLWREGGGASSEWNPLREDFKMAESPNHTTVYIPVGTNGLPLIKPAN